mmetsp:Transcript_806/g.2601  ORF Transcript_806/g.2601 Transcript_806/m.2601 type:complete len:1023 (+) Transcript_806:185-3253(+)
MDAVYRTVPELRNLSSAELRRVRDFTAYNKYGSIQWPGETDLSGLDLRRSIHIGHGEVSVEDEFTTARNPTDRRLNRSATVVLYGVRVCSLCTSEQSAPKGQCSCREALELVCGRTGASMRDYREEDGRVTFSVDHFSRYGLFDEDSSQDEEDRAEAPRSEVPPRASAATTSRGGSGGADEDMLTDLQNQTATPSRVLSAPDDWSDAGDETDMRIDDGELGASATGMDDTVMDQQDEPGKDSSLFRSLEMPRLHRMQRLLFTHDEKQRSPTSLDIDMRASPVPESTVTTDTEDDTRRVKTPRRQEPVDTQTEKDLPSFSVSLLRRAIEQTEPVSGIAAISLRAYKPLEQSVLAGAESRHQNPVLARGRSFRVSFSGGGNLASVLPPQRPGDTFKVAVWHPKRSRSRDMYHSSMMQHYKFWHEGGVQSHSLGSSACPTLENALGGSTEDRTRYLLTFAELFHKQGKVHLANIFRLLIALYGGEETSRDEDVRRRLSDWLTEYVSNWSQSKPPRRSFLQEAHSLLSAGLVDDAVDAVLSHGHPRLALLLSRAMEFPGKTFQSNVESFLKEYEAGSGLREDAKFEEDMVDLLRVLSGNVADTKQLKALSWYRAFGLVLWYSRSSRQSLSIKSAILAFKEMWEAEVVAPPVPPFAAFVPMGERVHTAKEGHVDAAFHILCLFADVCLKHGVERTFSPLSVGEEKGIMDFYGSWFIFEALRGIVGGAARFHREIRLHSAFSQQLEASHSPLWAVYVMSACSPGQERDAHLRSLIWRLWPELERETKIPGGETTGIAKFLTQHLKIPGLWLIEAKALWSRYCLDKTEEVEAFCALARHPECELARVEAHSLLCDEVAPRVASLILKQDSRWEAAVRRISASLTTLSQLNVPNWNTRGSVLVQFAALLLDDDGLRSQRWNDGELLHNFSSQVTRYQAKDDGRGNLVKLLMANFGASLERRLFLIKAGSDTNEANIWGEVARADLINVCLSSAHGLRLAGEYAGDDKLGIDSNRLWCVPLSTKFGVPMGL